MRKAVQDLSASERFARVVMVDHKTESTQRRPFSFKTRRFEIILQIIAALLIIVLINMCSS